MGGGSFGTRLIEPGSDQPLDDLIAAADENMYENKRKKKASLSPGLADRGSDFPVSAS